MRTAITSTGNSFNSRRESSLHFQIKEWYFQEGDRVEAKVDNFVIDILRKDLLIEIQTTNFSAIKFKLSRLLNGHKVRLVYPIAKVKWIVRKSIITRETYGRRRSPRKGRLTDLFNELIRIPSLFLKDNLSIEVLMVEMEEIWCNDGRGNWRRKGASIEDRRLLRVLERRIFENKAALLKMLPEDLTDPFSNMDLSKILAIPIGHSRKMTYALRKMGAITCAGKNRNQLLFERTKTSNHASTIA